MFYNILLMPRCGSNKKKHAHSLITKQENMLWNLGAFGKETAVFVKHVLFLQQ